MAKRSTGRTSKNKDTNRPMTDRERARAKKRQEAQRKRLRKMKRIRAVLLLILLIILIIILIRSLINRGKKEEINNSPNTSTVTESETEKSNLSQEESGGFSQILNGYVKTLTKTNFYPHPDDGEEAEGSFEVGEYLETYGQVGKWIKVKKDGETGYVQTSNVKKLEDPNQLFVKKGVLLVNRKYSLPEDFDPGLTEETQEAFNRMQEAAKKDGIRIEIGSGYRDFAHQKEVHEDLVRESSEDRANQVSAQAGFSEHQTGQAIDIIGSDPSTNIDQSFDDTEEAKWLENNAYKYGFHLRFMKGKENITGYEYESWHFRYLGKDLATELHLSGLCLEEYLDEVENYSSVFQESAGIKGEKENPSSENENPPQESESEGEEGNQGDNQ